MSSDIYEYHLFKHKVIYFYNCETVLKKILEDKKSFIRFGDGEVRIIVGHKIATLFQEFNDDLQIKLKEIITSKSNKFNIMIARLNGDKDWYYDFICENINIEEPILDAQIFRKANNELLNNVKVLWNNKNVVYIGSSISYSNIKHINVFNYDTEIPKSKKYIMDISNEDFQNIKLKNNIFCDELLKILNNLNLDELQNNNEITFDVKIIKYLLHCDQKKYWFMYRFLYEYFSDRFANNCRIFESISSIPLEENIKKIYNNAKSLYIMKTNYKNAHNQYIDIINKCLQYDIDTIFILSCGPTGKVIGYELINKNYTVYDLGHFHKI